MNFIKKVFNVSFANIIQVLSGTILGFVLPAFLSINQYGNFKTYSLIMSYIGLLNLGFADGIFIDYGGKVIKKIKKTQLKSDFLFLIIMESVFSVIGIILSGLMHSVFGLVVSLSIIPFNICTYFKRIYQSTDELKCYSKNIMEYSIIVLILSIFSILLKEKTYLPYCMIMCLGNMYIVIKEGSKIIKLTSDVKCKFDIKRYRGLIETGMYIMLGNIAVNLFYGIDRWVVKIFFGIQDFAYYSFAVSMLNIIVTVLQAISLTMFTYLVKHKDDGYLAYIKDIILLLGVLVSLSYFVLDKIVVMLLPKYIPSMKIIAITMAIFPYMMYITAITINLYKINKQEKIYLREIVLMLAIVFILDLVMIPLKRTSLIAYATLASYIIWFVLARWKMRYEININIFESIYLICNTVFFLIVTQAGTLQLLYVFLAIMSSALWGGYTYIKYKKSKVHINYEKVER